MKRLAKTIYTLLPALLWALLVRSQTNEVAIDQSKHEGLIELSSSGSNSIKVLYSEGHQAEAKKQADLISDAYAFLSNIMGPKKDFCVLVVAQKDWGRNAYIDIPGMPEYYKGNIIVDSRTSPNSLYDAEIATMEGGGSYNQDDAEGFLRIQGLPSRVQGSVTPRKY